MVNAAILVSGLLATLAAANPVSQLMKRDPSDTSGNSNMNLECNEQIIPNPGTTTGTGEGGSAFFHNNLYFQPPNNQAKVYPQSCTVFKDNANCNTCIINGGGLEGDVSVLACWNPPAGAQGCSMQFSYKGYNYNTQTKEPVCGHRKIGGTLGGATFLGICYFNE